METVAMKLKNVFRVALTLAVAVAVVAPVGAQQSLQQQNEQILNELKAIRQLLERLAGPIGGGGVPAPVPTMPTAPVNDNVSLPSVTGIMIGKADAPLTMIEYTDLQCPFCRQYHITAYEQIKKEWIDTGKLRYLVRDLPIESIHPQAMPGARATRCAGEQGKLWEMRHSILLNNQRLTNEAFATFAQDLKLNMGAFNKCYADTTKFQAEITKDMTEAASVGISATPSFVIGRTSAGAMDGVRFIGAQPYAAFDAKLKELAAKTP
jgi:protein-disulfide isomerase